LFQHFDTLANRLHGTPGSVWILDNQEAVKTLHVEQR
jgi:hypothetical protein